MPRKSKSLVVKGTKKGVTARDQLLSSISSLFQYWMEYQRTLVREEGITLAHLVILRRIRARGAISLSLIARYASESRSALTGIIDTLEKKDLVTRVRDSSDRRRINIVLTEKCTSLFNQIESRRNLILEELVKTIPREDLEKLNQSMVLATKNLKERELKLE